MIYAVIESKQTAGIAGAEGRVYQMRTRFAQPAPLPTGYTDPVHILRLTFVGSEATTPIISECSRNFGVDFNILAGQIDEVQGENFGTLTVLISCKTDLYAKALDFLRERKVTYEEVTKYVL